MRILSQDGTLDLPYENIAISRGYRGDKKEFYIFAHIINCVEMDKMPQKLAIYSTEARAQKAMEMLREYKETKEIRSIPLTKYLMESFSNVKMENFEIYTDGTGDYLKVDIVKKVEYFQFPQDEDVEV